MIYLQGLVRFSIAGFALYALQIDQALAYLDGATGGMLLQLILGGVSGFLVVVSLYWQRLKAFFFRKKACGCAENDDSNTQQEN